MSQYLPWYWKGTQHQETWPWPITPLTHQYISIVTLPTGTNPRFPVNWPLSSSAWSLPGSPSLGSRECPVCSSLRSVPSSAPFPSSLRCPVPLSFHSTHPLLESLTPAQVGFHNNKMRWNVEADSKPASNARHMPVPTYTHTETDGQRKYNATVAHRMIGHWCRHN